MSSYKDPSLPRLAVTVGAEKAEVAHRQPKPKARSPSRGPDVLGLQESRYAGYHVRRSLAEHLLGGARSIVTRDSARAGSRTRRTRGRDNVPRRVMRGRMWGPN